MTRAVAYRLPDDMVIRIKDASAQAGLSATAYVREAIEARLGAPPLTESPMVADDEGFTTAPPGAMAQALRQSAQRLAPTGDVPRDTPQPVLETCAHPFRDEQNICRVCGEQR
jgi:hypothetical protein